MLITPHTSDSPSTYMDWISLLTPMSQEVGGRRTMLSVWSRQLRPQQFVINAGTQQLSEPGCHGVKHYIRGDHWWLLLDCRDRRASTEMDAAVPGTPKLLSLFHDVLLLSENLNNHPNPRLLAFKMTRLTCRLTVWVLIIAGLIIYPNHFLCHWCRDGTLYSYSLYPWRFAKTHNSGKHCLSVIFIIRFNLFLFLL